jgi:DNA topoisomerase VI subunit B
MRTKWQSVIAVAAVLIALFTTGGAVPQQSSAKEKDQQRNVTKLELTISKDGRAIVDQNGKIVARFVKGTRVQIATKGVKAESQKMKGCWRCYPVCVIYEGTRCVQWMRTCDWDFDC